MKTGFPARKGTNLILSDAGLVYLEDLLFQILQHPPLSSPP
jgi:hypothetical protein